MVGVTDIKGKIGFVAQEILGKRQRTLKEKAIEETKKELINDLTTPMTINEIEQYNKELQKEMQGFADNNLTEYQIKTRKLQLSRKDFSPKEYNKLLKEISEYKGIPNDLEF